MANRGPYLKRLKDIPELRKPPDLAFEKVEDPESYTHKHRWRWVIVSPIGQRKVVSDWYPTKGATVDAFGRFIDTFYAHMGHFEAALKAARKGLPAPRYEEDNGDELPDESQPR